MKRKGERKILQSFLSSPNLSESSRALAEESWRKYNNARIDPEPIVMFAWLAPGKQYAHLTLLISDEDCDLIGIKVRETHVEPNGNMPVIQEAYPVFSHHLMDAVCMPTIPVKIREVGERKDEIFWQEYLDTGLVKAGPAPKVLISIPEAGKSDVMISLYDGRGHTSKPIPLANHPVFDINN